MRSNRFNDPFADMINESLCNMQDGLDATIRFLREGAAVAEVTKYLKAFGEDPDLLNGNNAMIAVKQHELLKKIRDITTEALHESD